MAYAAVVSLGRILKQILNSDQTPFDYPKPEIESLSGTLSSLQTSLEKLSRVPKTRRDDVAVLEVQIREAMHLLEDAFESYISTQILPELESASPFLQDLKDTMANIGSITKRAQEIAAEIGTDEPPLPDKDEDLSYQPALKGKIVGQEEYFDRITGQLLKSTSQELELVPIVGMAGIGKTTLAKSIYDDEKIKGSFPLRAWVTVPQDYSGRDIYAKLLNSMERNGKKIDEKNYNEDQSDLGPHLNRSLFHDKFLVVIDDVWEADVWSKLERFLPKRRKGSRVLLTSRFEDVVSTIAKPDEHLHVMSPLSDEHSWELLCHHAFSGGNCPSSDLEVIGRSIAVNCGGLPLSITVIGGHLSKEEKTTAYWKTVQEDIISIALSSEESTRYLKILSLSYNRLPYKLKGCFLYMGAFPEDTDIPASKLVKLWVAEGFLPERSEVELEPEWVAAQSLKDLADRNLISVRNISSRGTIRSCGMHDSVRALSMDEAQKEKYFHTINKYIKEFSSKDTVYQRRISVHRNVLVCMKDLYELAKSIKPARTILYAGSHHHHPMPYCLTYDSLRVLDGLTVYFIEFPSEILKLVHLRYLAFTYNGKLPPSISKLQNLEVLIVRHHPKIIYSGISLLPPEIWTMSKLRHLHFTESDLPLPSALGFDASSSVLLENLQSLTNVNARCCTKEVLRNIPNLKKLSMWVESPGVVDLHIIELTKLETLEFVVLMPLPDDKIDFQPKLAFPKTLKKLSLSGTGLPWTDMKIIAEQLPKLEVLKLREFAFLGPKWEPGKSKLFPELKYLMVEALDFKCWEANRKTFPKLERLIMRHCYEIEELDPDIGSIGPLQLIDMVDCSPAAVEWAEYVKDEQKDVKTNFQVRITCSWGLEADVASEYGM